MKIIKKELSRELDKIEIVPLADLHIGDAMCDYDLIKSKINYIANTKDCYCVLNGDIMNNTTRTSVGDIFAEKLKPMEQLKKAIDLLRPIKDRILAVTNGNHEARTWKNEGIDLMDILSTELDIEDVYTRESALLFLRFGKCSKNMKETNNPNEVRMVSYTIYLTHGSGGGRKEGAKAIRLADMASIIDADIYIHSHTHLPMTMKQRFYRTDIRNSTVALVDKLFVNTSSMLDYGGYGETFEYKPSSKDTPHIYLNGKRKEFIAKL